MIDHTLSQRLNDLAPAMQARGATGLSIFGSRARGDNRPDSDLDGLIDYDPARRFSLLDLVAIERLVHDKLGIRADLTTRPALHPLLRARIEREAVEVF